MQPTSSTAAAPQSDIHKTMQSQPQQIFISSSGSNGTSNARQTQQTNTMYRGPPSSAAPRGGARHVSMQPMFQQPMHQSVVLPTYSAYAPRQPTYQSAQYPYSQTLQPFYSSYQFYQPIQQPPTHQRGPVGVSQGVGVGNAISVQPSPNGPPGAPQTQLSIAPGTVLSVPPCPSTVLSVASSGPGQQQIGVGMPSIVGVGVPVTGAVSSSIGQNKVRRRKHALDIIDPDTKRNIFEDIEAKCSNANEPNNQEKLISTPLIVGEMQTVSPQAIVLTADSRPVIYNMDVHQMQQQQQRDIACGQTPIVSAMSDAPSVEIRPTLQKPRSKRIPITSPKDEPSKVTSSENIEDESSKHMTHTNTSTDTSADLPQLPQLSQVPLECQNQPNQYSQLSIKSPQLETQDVAFIANENKTNKKKPISKESRFAAHDQQADSEINRPNMESEQRSEVDYCRNSCASSVAFDSDKVASETDVDKNEIEHSVGAVEESKNSVEIMNIVEQDKVELCTSDLTQNENVLVSFNNVDEYKNNTAKESLMSDENVNVAAEVVADGKQLNNIDYAPVARCDMSIYDETDRSSIEPKNLVSETNNTEEISLKSPPTHSESSSITKASSIESKINLLANPFQTPQTTVSAPTIVPVAHQSLIQYNEGQWSPQNPTGKKRYNREQLLKLREAKASRIQPDVKNASILPQPNLMPSFARGNNSKRVQSMVGSIGGNRCGPDGGSYISKQASMSGVNSRGSTKGMIHVNLSLNQDVKLSETDNAWRPRALVSGKEVEGDSANQPQREKEDLIRSVRGILNKLTPEKFDKLVEEILKLRIDTPDKLEAVMILVFEKAIDEPIFSVSYARLCNRLIGEVKGIKRNTSNETKANLAHFRNALLDKTEREFTQNVSNCAAKEAKLQPILDKIKNCTDPIEKIELQAQLEEEERKIRRRSGGTVRFIGELFKISLLTGNIINHCIDTLLEPKTEDMLECLCKLLTTVGAKFEQTQILNKDENNKEIRFYSLNRVVARMQTIASKNDNVKVSSRVRFMLLDVIDLRKNKWQSSKNEAPKTMEQIEKEAKNEQLSSQYLNYTAMLPGSGGGGSSGGANSSSCKRDDRLNNRYDSRSSLGYGSSHNQRSDSSSLRRQQQGGAGGSSGGNSGGNNSGSSNFGGDDNAWQVQTSKGRSLAVDSNKLEGLNFTQSLDMGSKKMGGVSQFIWNQQRQSAPTLAPTNSFAVLSTLVDSNKNSSDRGGTRNKGSVERDRYNNDRGIHSRTGSSQGSRENSSSRIQQGGRAMINASTVQKSASHKNYTQLMSPRNSVKSTGASSTSANALHPHHQHEQLHQISQSQQASGVEFTNKSLFPSAPPMAVFDTPSATEQQLMKSVTLEFIEATANVKIVTTALVPIINRLPDNQRCGYLYYILTDYLHLANVNQLHRRYLANIVIYMIKHKFIALEHFCLAYEQLCEISSDLIYDVPELWLYVFEFVAPLLQKQILTIHDLWIEKLQESDTEKLGQKFLKSFLVCCTREIGPNFTKGLWIKFNMAWTDFMPKSEVQNFIQCNKFEYIENESAPLEILVKENFKHVVERVELLLLEGSDHNAIIDYINGNIANVDKKFVSSLTTVITNFAIQLKDGTYKLDTVRFQKVCLPVLQRYIDVNAERELECLYAMQYIVNSLEHPRGLLPELFAGLYDHDVITIESFLNWRDSKDQPAGKGVAVKGLGPFFNGLLSGETSEENN